MHHSFRRISTSARRQGFTLVETLAALMVIVVGIVPAVVLLLSSRSLDQQAQVQAAAYQAARQEMETLRARLFANRATASQASWTIPANITSEFPNQSITGDYNIATYGSSTKPSTQQVVVRVRWNRLNSPGMTSSIVLDTLFAQEPGK